MKEGETLFQFFNKYKHGLLIFIYSAIYMAIFYYLEHRPVKVYNVVHTLFDDAIPFCELFIVPYLLWFPYILITVLYFIFINKNKQEYYQLTMNLIMGMTVFLVISYIYPNIQHLRPVTFSRNNIFIDMVAMLYQTDTPTNILPSIHVFNSLAIHKSITSCEALKNHRILHMCSLILTILIVLATMFLKQHSVIDVCLGITLALFGFLLFYPIKEELPVKKGAMVPLHKPNHKF